VPTPATAPPSAPETIAPAPVADGAPNDAGVAPADVGTELGANVIAPDDTLATLRARHGDAQAVAAKVPGAEGEELDGWLLFPDDATRRVYVYLDDDGRPALARVLDRESTWRRIDGVHTGLTLAELAQRNGAPVGFMGFDWDYGGVVTDWHGGRLQRDPPLGGMQLCPPETEATAEPGYPAGDGEFDSTNPWVVAHPPVVCAFDLNLAPPPASETAP
jgi:hypothetical protein